MKFIYRVNGTVHRPIYLREERYLKGEHCDRRRGHLLRAVLLTLAVAVTLTSPGVTATDTVSIKLVKLNGPWKFHTGDDARWAAPDFDDSGWETMDLTAAPDAHDDDVGLTGYGAGWQAKGHRGYSGYAWYRLRVSVTALEGPEGPIGQNLSLAGPAAADSAYQVFMNGKLLGSSGVFSGQTPTAFSIRPRVFAIPSSLVNGDRPATAVIAFRVWMGPWDLADPSAGGIHIAPTLGEAGSIAALHQVQWLQTFRGYIVEVVEATAFLLLAVMAATLAAFEESKRAYRWLCIALVLTALFRANQAVFFWGQFEPVRALELISVVLLIPACLAAWTLAWHAWFQSSGPEERTPGKPQTQMPWLPPMVGVLAIGYVAAQFLAASWFHGMVPHWVATACGFVIRWTRIAFVALTGSIVYQAIRRQGPETWIALPALVLVSFGQFARELSALGIKGIWFPFGTGVSRTQFAYATFDVVLFALLLRRFLFFARGQQPALVEGRRAAAIRAEERP